MWSHLNRYDLPDDESCSEALRRILGRIGDYAEHIVRPLNMRPTAAALLAASGERVEVRISAPGGHVVLAIRPDGDMAAEVAWLRAMATKNLPAARLIHHDLSCASVPFSFAIVSFIGGVPLDTVADEALMRVAARQVGRTLRRMHQIEAPGFGRPTLTGRWPAPDWPSALRAWLDATGALVRAEELLGAELAAALWEATLDHPALECPRARVIHGAVGPGRAVVTLGESVQLEALARPGELVGGDPLLDLAQGLLPSRPPAFRQGLLEGYAAAGPLDPAQRAQLRRLGLIALIADAATCPGSDPALPDRVAAELAALGHAG